MRRFGLKLLLSGEVCLLSCEKCRGSEPLSYSRRLERARVIVKGEDPARHFPNFLSRLCPVSISEYIPGSPLNALNVQPPFHEYYFIDMDGGRAASVEQLCEGMDNVMVRTGDCNEILLKWYPLSRAGIVSRQSANTITAVSLYLTAQ